MKPADLPQIRTPGTPALSPDGRVAVVAVARADLATDSYTSQLWLVPTDGSRPAEQLTRGWHDSAPRCSPDGRHVAFLRRADKAARPQLWLLPLAGGDAWPLTDCPLGAGVPDWSPDGARLAFSARVPQESRYGTASTDDGEPIGPDGEPPRRLTQVFNRLDGLGFFRDRPSHVFTVTPAGELTRLAEGQGDPRFSPDGEWLTYLAPPGDEWSADVCVCRADGSDQRVLTSGTFAAAQPRFRPDGRAVLFTAAPAAAVLRNETLWSIPLDGGEAVPLLDPARYHLAMPGGDMDVTPQGALFMHENRGAVELLRVPYTGEEPTPLVTGARQVAAFACANGVLVTNETNPSNWGELYAGDRPLTAFNEGFEALEQVELTATAPDGYPVHGWVVRPAGEGPHPVLLMIHGGPYSQYGWRLFDEPQVYADAGYAVVYGNPRGSSGYGEAHGEPIRGNVGEVSATDLLALLDAALADPGLDASRVGVLGGSHGGFMTTWLAAHHGDRFRAAVSERAVNAIDSFMGSSDIGWFFADALYGGDVARQSPLSYADRISLPMLIIHSEQDWRCPVEQAYRLFVALKRNGTPAELLLFPGEGHELSRSGRPSHRIQRFEAILDWFGRHL
ncbi:S9 family peptidase [Dactylosporangium sp. CA-139114]|uniref:S9 family peptidase n=1 Tax=Dactylosporangium sp. CA-139114 TaxID=3239931 RepID=UPI003D98CB29